MTKQELYSKIISVQKTTGQGTPKFILINYPEATKALEDEGLIKAYTQEFNTLPSDVTYVPTQGYNVWGKGDWMQNLTFVRVYLGHDDLGMGVTSEDIKNSDSYPLYLNWVSENKEQLEIMVNLDEEYPPNGIVNRKQAEVQMEFSEENENENLVLSENDDFIDEDMIEWAYTKDWYNENLCVKDAIIECEEGRKTDKEIKSLSTKLIKLYGDDPRYANKKANEIRELELIEKKVPVYRTKLIEMLNEYSPDTLIQEIF